MWKIWTYSFPTRCCEWGNQRRDSGQSNCHQQQPSWGPWGARRASQTRWASRNATLHQLSTSRHTGRGRRRACATTWCSSARRPLRCRQSAGSADAGQCWTAACRPAPRLSRVAGCPSPRTWGTRLVRCPTASSSLGTSPSAPVDQLEHKKNKPNLSTALH